MAYIQGATAPAMGDGLYVEQVLVYLYAKTSDLYIGRSFLCTGNAVCRCRAGGSLPKQQKRMHPPAHESSSARLTR